MSRKTYKAKHRQPSNTNGTEKPRRLNKKPKKKDKRKRKEDDVEDYE